MPDNHQTSLQLTFRPSKRLKNGVIFVHLIALGASVANALVFAIKTSLFACIGMHCWWTVRRLNTGPYAIKHTEALGWEVSEGGDFAPVEILKSTVITPFALFLHFRYSYQAETWKPGDKRALLILRDALNEEDYRCLIVKLKTTAIK
jgi:toxin CptA